MGNKKERETALKQLSRANCHRAEHTPIARKMSKDYGVCFALRGRNSVAFLFLSVWINSYLATFLRSCSAM